MEAYISKFYEEFCILDIHGLEFHSNHVYIQGENHRVKELWEGFYHRSSYKGVKLHHGYSKHLFAILKNQSKP